MKPTMIIGIVLIALGLAGVIFGGIRWYDQQERGSLSYTTRENVVDIGGLHVTSEKEKTIPIPIAFIVGGVVLVGGIAVVVVASKKTA